MADDPRTSGMIALIPTAEDAARLAVQGGDDPDDLHLTLAYLGDDVTAWDDDVVDQLAADLDQATATLDKPLVARVMGHAQFNPDGGPSGDRDPCAVYLVGDTNQVGPLKDAVLELLGGYGLPIPDQHTPFLPHVTAGYKLDPAALAAAGPISFDRVRLAMGEEVIDVPIGVLADHQRPAATPPPVAAVPPLAAAATEIKAASPDPRAARLRAYWAHGAGLAKWFRGLGTPGNFRRLRRQLAAHVHGERMLNGLTANIYHEATGQWPGRRSSKGLPAWGEFKSMWDYDDPADVANDADQGMFTGIEEWGGEFLEHDDIADPDGDASAASADPAPAPAEAKSAPPVGLVTITAADLHPSLFDDEDQDDGVLSEADQLLMDVDAAILAGDQLISSTDSGDESWTEVATRDMRYQVGADGVLTPAQGSVGYDMGVPSVLS